MYDLSLSPEQLEMRDTVREFAARDVKPYVLNADRLQDLAWELPLELVGKASQLGLRALLVPEEQGGAGADTLTACIVFEELAAADVHVAVTIAETARLAGLLFGGGMTGAQCDRLLPAFLADDHYHLAYAGPDPDAELGWGYHRPAALEPPVGLRATREANGDWVLNGTARYVPNAPVAKLFAAAADTGGEQLVLLVAADARGVSVRDHRTGAGAGQPQPVGPVPWYHGLRGEVTFANCRVPAGDRLEAAGAARLMTGAAAGRGSPQLQAINLGVGQAALDAAVEYAKLRVQGGRPIVGHQAIGSILAEAAVRITVARSIVWQAAWAADHPEAHADRSLPDLPLQTVAKVYTAQAVHEATELAAECFGAMGVMRDMPLHKYLHDARIFVQSGQSNTVARFRIAEALAGYERPQRQSGDGSLTRAA